MGWGGVCWDFAFRVQSSPSLVSSVLLPVLSCDKKRVMKVHHRHQEHRHHQDKDHPNKVGVGLLAKKHLAAQLSVSLQRGNPQHPFAHMLLVPTCKLNFFLFFCYFSSTWQLTISLYPLAAFADLPTQSLNFRKLELNVYWPCIATATSHWQARCQDSSLMASNVAW